jgi:acyl-CoA reductase-like NAD-dependent aldehyde dehydrogenase
MYNGYEASLVSSLGALRNDTGWDVHQPLGGFALSGSAFKEQGTEGLSFFTRIKSVAVRAGGL